MPGRARGRAKGRQRAERVRRPGEPPEQGLPHPPQAQAGAQTGAQAPAPSSPPAQQVQDAPVEEMAALALGAGGGQEVVYQRTDADGRARQQAESPPGSGEEVVYQRTDTHGGARPKTKSQPPGRGWADPKGQGDTHRGRNVPVGRGSPPDDHGQGRQRAGESGGAEGGAVPPNEEVVYERRRSGGGQDRSERPDRRERRRQEDVTTRPSHIASKQGTSGRKVILTTNYFSLDFPNNLVLYQYHVDYNPPCESRKVKLALLYVHENLIGRVHAFDGAMLFIPRRLQNPVTEVYSTRQSDNAQIRITIKLTNELPPNDPQSIQVFNIIFRRQLRTLDMTQVQRHYFDFSSRIPIPRHRLQVIPGVAASILQYESQVMLNVDIAHKLIRMDTVLDVMYEEYKKRNNQDDIYRRVVGSIVLTRYNNRTYRVDDIDFNMFPHDTFQLSNGTRMSYQDYFKQHYQEKVTDPDQPLLVSRPKARDRNGGEPATLYLVPEFCVMTGLTDEMRADFQVMKDVAVHTRIPPGGRIERLQLFRNRFNENQRVREELQNWNFALSPNLVELPGRVLEPERIFQANNIQENAYKSPKEDVYSIDLKPLQLSYRPQDADWSTDMRGKKLLVPVPLTNWLVLYPRRCTEHANDLVQTLSRVCPPMGMTLARPQMVEMNDDRNDTYVRALSDNVTGNTQMVVCVVTNQKKDRYDAIKKFCVCERPVPSQVVVQRTLTKKQMLMSVSTKIAIQLNCKLGGEVWALQIPFNTPFMVIGIDTYHDSSVRNRSVGGVVCSLNKSCTRFYSRVTFQTSHVELVNGLTTVCTAALKKFHEVNNALPEKIFIFRDGVGDGQLDAVFEHEMPQLLQSFKISRQEYKPKVAFIVVKKRINTRFFTRVAQTNAASNPPPGTVVDSVVTNRNWYDFYLISQSVRQGTVSPTHYNVIWDTTGLQPEHLQRLSYKMTHLYYNWPGTIRVPAACQYAHKLAFLVGQSIHREPSLHLADKLFYL